MAQNYYTGGSGKQYVTNEKTGNITVNGKVYSPGQSGYAAVRSAMEADTGRQMGGTNVVRASNASSGGGTTASGTAANSVSSTSNPHPGAQAVANGITSMNTYDYANIIKSPNNVLSVEYAPGKYQNVNPGDSKYAEIANAWTQIGDTYTDANGVVRQKDAAYYAQHPRQNYWDLAAAKETGQMSGYDQYANLMNQGRDAYERALRQKLGLAEDVNARAIAATNQAYDQAANNAYIAYMQQQRQMPQQLARLGLAGTGTSESAALGAATNYQNNLNQNEVTRNQAMNDLYLALQQNYADAASEQAAYENSLYQALANAYLQQYNTDRNYNYQTSRDAIADQRYADETAYNREWQQKQWDQQLANEEYQRMLDRYGVNLTYGIVTPEMVKSFAPGMTYEQYKQAVNKALWG